MLQKINLAILSVLAVAVITSIASRVIESFVNQGWKLTSAYMVGALCMQLILWIGKLEVNK